MDENILFVPFWSLFILWWITDRKKPSDEHSYQVCYNWLSSVREEDRCKVMKTPPMTLEKELIKKKKWEKE
jgi:hypothetical protein